MLCSRFVRHNSSSTNLIHSVITSKKRRLRIKTRNRKQLIISYTITTNFCYFCRLIIREFGQKNAKLICIKDENSICEPDSETEDNNQHDVVKKVVRICSQTQTEIIPAVETKNKNVKISRLPKKSLKPLEMLPKDYIFTVAQYKLCLCDYNKGNCLYMKSAMRKPWLLMGK